LSKRVVILGGGISGLTAGIYAQKRGFDSEIYEKQKIPGGECTGWDREGYHIDGCIHWLTGSSENNSFGRVWREIGALGPDIDIYYPDCFCTVEYGGTTIKLHRDLEMLRAHLADISPDDKAEIDALCDAIGNMKDFGIPSIPPDMMNPFDILQFLRNMSRSMKIMNRFHMSLSEYLQRFRHPAIRAALANVLPSDNCAYVLPYTLGTFCSGNGGRPEGGSRAMALRMAAHYKSMGGRLLTGKEAVDIQIDSGRAVKVTFADGGTVSGDYIIPAMDIHVVLNNLLKGKYTIPQIIERDADHAAYPSPTCVYAAFGIDADLSGTPADLLFEVSPIRFEDRDLNVMNMKHYCYEPSFAPPGKSVAIVYQSADYDWWKNKHRDPEAYRNEKERLMESFAAAIEEHYPDLKGRVKPLDMATPVTYERYCGAWRGSWMAYGHTPKGRQTMLSGRIKGIDNLFMSGQWLMPPGGLPTAIVTGKWAIQRICRKEKLPWRW